MQAGADLQKLIDNARNGDAQAVDSLYLATYRELRNLAHARLSLRRRGTLLNTTALVHESYLRPVDAGQLRLTDRAHFMRYAARAMRSVIVDIVRKRQSERHGGLAARVDLNTEIADGLSVAEDQILGVHAALDELAKLDARMAQLVEMRYFAGMTEAEIAQAFAVTDRTVRREWEKARLWLSAALQQ
jgi:RNA polymerase sigma factor (TIGR02999 family)